MSHDFPLKNGADKMRFQKALRVAPLAALSVTEMSVAFIRMFILTHLLGPYEFGFSAALSAAYATVEQMTDTGLYRFVLAAPRERYKSALATAHGIALLRGILVAALFVAIAYPTSCTMIACGDWTSFIWLAPVSLIKSFENLELRVYERDYRYWPQLAAAIGSNVCGLGTMLLIGWETGDHRAFLAYMIVQSLTFVAITHILAKSRFSVLLRGPMTRDALDFSIPLMANGIGLAILTQGDRLLAAVMLGVETLGLYAVLFLTAYVPTAALFRLIGPVLFAGLINSAGDRPLYLIRLKLYSRAVPVLAAVYALGWLALGSSLIPAVFGSRFVVNEVEVLLVGMIVFFRICRTEPASELLLQTHNTRRLALVNQVPVVGLGIAALLTWIHPALESLLIGTSLGEFICLVATLAGARKAWGSAWSTAIAWCGMMAMFPALVGLSFVYLGEVANDHLVTRIAIAASCAVLVCTIAGFALIGLIRTGYGKGAGVRPVASSPEAAALSQDPLPQPTP